MTNKTLRRILLKTMGVNSAEELATALPTVGAHEGILEVLANIDKAMTDLDRVIDIRDRSLTISSKELVELNAEITAQASQQSAALNQLHSTLKLLRQSDSAPAYDGEHDLQKLVEVVGELVRSQLRSTYHLKILFEEGQRISSVMNFHALEATVQAAVDSLTGHPAKVRIYFSGRLFDRQDSTNYYLCTDTSARDEPLDTSALQAGTIFHYVNVKSPKSNGILAILKVDFGSLATHAEALLERLQPILPNIGSTLENIGLMQEEKLKQRLEAELATAHFVQQALLPAATPTVIDGTLELTGIYKSATECGGDWWTYFQLKDGRHIVLVGDVTGHGTGSAMVCAVVKGYCDTFLRRSELSLAQILEEINEVLFHISVKVGTAMTMAAISIDANRALLTFANAGHPHPVLVQAPRPGSEARTVNFLVNSGNIMGLSERSIYLEKVFPFRFGDQLVIYSDGLTEAKGHKLDMYGDKRLSRVLAATKEDSSAADVSGKILDDWETFARGMPVADDITCVVVKNIHRAAVQTMPNVSSR